MTGQPLDLQPSQPEETKFALKLQKINKFQIFTEDSDGPAYNWFSRKSQDLSRLSLNLEIMFILGSRKTLVNESLEVTLHFC